MDQLVCEEECYMIRRSTFFLCQLHALKCVTAFDKMQIVLLALGKVKTGLADELC